MYATSESSILPSFFYAVLHHTIHSHLETCISSIDTARNIYQPDAIAPTTNTHIMFEPVVKAEASDPR